MDFTRMRGRQDLHDYVGCDPQVASSLLNANWSDLFIQHWIPKAGGKGWREVWEVRDRTVADIYKSLSTKLDRFLKDRLAGYPSPQAHGYVRRRSTLTNASKHLGAKVMLKADIRAFFRNIGQDKVDKVFEDSGVNEEARALLVRLLIWQNHAPLGLPTSPLLANAVCLQLDRQLEGLVPGGSYTRYADDLTFSGPALPAIDGVDAIIRGHGFQLATEKTRYLRSGRGLYVTGLSLEASERPHVARKLKRSIRQELYFAKKYGLAGHAGWKDYGSVGSAANKIEGMVSYIQGIDSRLGEHLSQQCFWVQGTPEVPRTFFGATENGPSDVVFLLDECTPNGSAAQILCLTVVEDPSFVGSKMQEMLGKMRAEPEVLNADILDTKGLHWAELHPDHRSTVARQLRLLPFRAFVAYEQHPTEYAEAYERLFRVLVADRMKKHHGQRITVLIEQNSQINETRLRSILQEAFDAIKARVPHRSSFPPQLKVIEKNDVAYAPLPDLVLGIAGEFLNIKRKNHKGAAQPAGAQAEQRFKWIEGKVRAVYDLDTKKIFSRRNPLVPWEDQ